METMMNDPAGPARPRMTWVSVPGEGGRDQLVMRWALPGAGAAAAPAAGPVATTRPAA